MTKTEAIAVIARLLEKADGSCLAEAAQRLSAIESETIDGDTLAAAFSPDSLRSLSPQEHALLRQAEADFQSGRTLSIAEAEAFVTKTLAERRQKHAKA